MGDESDDNDGATGRPDWPPSETLWSELATLSERIRKSPLSGAWERASESAAKRLFEWWIDAGDDPEFGAEELFESRQVQTTDSASDQQGAPDGEGRWIRLISAAGSLLEAARQAGRDLSRLEEADGTAPRDPGDNPRFQWLSQEARASLAESWRELRSSYPNMSEALLRSFAESSNRTQEFESPGRVVVTSRDSEEQVNGGEDSGEASVPMEQWWSMWMEEAPAIEEFADRAVALAFREVFREADDFEGVAGTDESGGSAGAEKAAGFMRALERIMMSVVDATLLTDYPSDRKDERDDHSPPDD